MNAKQRYRAKRASEHRERKAAERRKRVGTADVLAQLVIQLRDTPVYDSADNVCLPNVWVYQAGHRNNRKDATHIIK